jgi:hypothetical protein
MPLNKTEKQTANCIQTWAAEGVDGMLNLSTGKAGTTESENGQQDTSQSRAGSGLQS